MYTVREISWPEFEETIAAWGTTAAIEQTREWGAYQATVEGREPWGCVAFERDGAVVAIASFIDFETHGYHYLCAHHAPLWHERPTEEEERAVLEALRTYVHRRDRRQVFVRLSVWHDLDVTAPTLSTIPYDTTVVVDITGGDDAILARMKPRGRRDVRKALREAPITCADETERAMASFDEYYAVMVETAQRDGFAPAAQGQYENMLKALGTDHCRVFAGRLEDGTLCTWSICTMSGTRGMRYYAASKSDAARRYATDKLSYYECCELGRLGCTDFDLMGIGSDFSPELNGLNTFKTKFSKEVVLVAPDRDVPVNKASYRMLTMAKGALGKVRSLRHG